MCNPVCVLADSSGITWLQFVAAQTISVIVGGIIPIALMFLKEKRESRKALAAWFETEYIEKCVSELAEFFEARFLVASQPARGVEGLANCTIPVLHPAMPRLSTITRSTEFRNWFAAMQVLRLKAMNFGDLGMGVKFQLQLANMALRLDDLRDSLVGVRIKSKRDIRTLRSLPCVTAFNTAITEMQKEMEACFSGKKYEARSEKPQ